MAEDLTIKVQKVAETINIGGDGKVQSRVQMTYTVGSHGPFTEWFEPGEFTSAKAKALMQARADTIRTIVS